MIHDGFRRCFQAVRQQASRKARRGTTWTAGSARRALLGAAVLGLPCALYAAGSGLPSAPVFLHPATEQEVTTLLAVPTRALAGAAAVSGDFRQRSQLHGLPQPLNSSGTFVVARGLGVDWHVRQPFDAETLLAGNRLIQRTGEGKSQSLAGDDQPGLAIVERTFDALFTLDVSQLAQRFRLYALPAQAGGGQNDWTLGLVPQDAALAEHLRAVVISGAQHVQRVTLYQGAGDHTEIHFDEVTVARALSPQQKALFAP